MTTTPVANPPARSHRQWLPVWFAIVVLVGLAVRQQVWVHRYAVPVLYWDAWDLYDPLFKGQGWWASFDQQHGPHRQGLGGWAIRVGAEWSRWDARVNAEVTSAALIAAAALGLLLAWRCGLRNWLLIAVPVLYLNVRQEPNLVALANPSHGAFPLLLLTATGLALFVRRPWMRAGLLTILTGCLIFTGFGLFAGLVVPPLLIHEAATARRRCDYRRAAAAAVAVVCIGVVWVGFSVGYHFDPAIDNFKFPVDDPVQYINFIGVLAANYIGAAGPSMHSELQIATLAAGITFTVVGVLVGVARGRKLWRAMAGVDPTSGVIFLLAAYVMLFAIDAAIGRTPAGWQTAVSSRYVTLCVPMGLAVLLHLGLSGGRHQRYLGVALAVWMSLATTVLPSADVKDCIALHNNCVRWSMEYRKTDSQQAADQFVHCPIYPLPISADRIEYLRRNQLNLYDPTRVDPSSLLPE